MAAVWITDTQNYIGSAAERGAMSTASVKAGSVFFEHDTQIEYKFDGTTWRAM